MRKIVLICLFGILAFAAGQTEKQWWQSSVFYQIYPRSYKDSNGDGIGDVKGIISKLQYLKETGITATWLSPILMSPQKDFGYDISNFELIDPIFGTNEDMDELFEEAKKLGIRIIFDFVPNHTSDKHQWFINSVNRVPGYEDFYVWHNGSTNPSGGRPLPPNNWQAVFSTIAWTWNDMRNQYYLHQFAIEQPDLNFRNPLVVQAMKDVLTFWLVKGVSGFRIDAINHMFEDDQFRDEPLTGWTNDETNYGYTHHVHTKDHPDTYKMVQSWRVLVDEFSVRNGGEQRVLITEAYASVDNTIRYYKDYDNTLGSHFPFNFGMIEYLNEWSNAHQFKNVIDDWIRKMPAGATANWVLGNHDKPRFGSRYGVERIDGMQMMLMVLPGVAVTYNGDEIGMVDYREISWEDTLDPQACNTNENDYVWASRDPQRTPFQWDDSAYAGFKIDNENQPWVQVHPDYVNNNLAKQMTAAKSHYKFYKQLIEFRKKDAFVHGEFISRALNDRVLGFQRFYNDEKFAILINFGGQTETIDVNELYVDFDEECEVVLAASTSKMEIGDKFKTASFELGAYDTIILQNVSSATSFTISITLILAVIVKLFF